MGTRADFYVGRDANAEWLGSIAFDGYPDGIDDAVMNAADEPTYRTAVAAFLAADDCATLPANGWPWPWGDSRTTDFAYAFDAGKVWSCGFGHGWFDHREAMPDGYYKLPKIGTFPDMSARANIAPPGHGRSGLMVFSVKAGE